MKAPKLPDSFLFKVRLPGKAGIYTLTLNIEDIPYSFKGSLSLKLKPIAIEIWSQRLTPTLAVPPKGTFVSFVIAFLHIFLRTASTACQLLWNHEGGAAAYLVHKLGDGCLCVFFVCNFCVCSTYVSSMSIYLRVWLHVCEMNVWPPLPLWTSSRSVNAGPLLLFQEAFLTDSANSLFISPHWWRSIPKVPKDSARPPFQFHYVFCLLNWLVETCFTSYSSLRPPSSPKWCGQGPLREKQSPLANDCPFNPWFGVALFGHTPHDLIRIYKCRFRVQFWLIAWRVGQGQVL